MDNNVIEESKDDMIDDMISNQDVIMEKLKNGVGVFFSTVKTGASAAVNGA